MPTSLLTIIKTILITILITITITITITILTWLPPQAYYLFIYNLCLLYLSIYTLGGQGFLAAQNKNTLYSTSKFFLKFFKIQVKPYY